MIGGFRSVSSHQHATTVHFVLHTLCSKLVNAQENFVNDAINHAVNSINNLKNSERNTVLAETISDFIC